MRQSFSSERFVFLHNLWGLGLRNFFELLFLQEFGFLRYLQLEGFLVKVPKSTASKFDTRSLQSFRTCLFLQLSLGPVTAQLTDNKKNLKSTNYGKQIARKKVKRRLRTCTVQV